MDIARKLSTIQKRENLNSVFALDERGSGNAHHVYLIVANDSDRTLEQIEFQKGPRKMDDSVNGVIDSDLLEIVRDRLQGFQSGEFATRENALALTHIEEALMWMNRRVEERIERNVLGTYNK